MKMKKKKKAKNVHKIYVHAGKSLQQFSPFIAITRLSLSLPAYSIACFRFQQVHKSINCNYRKKMYEVLITYYDYSLFIFLSPLCYTYYYYSFKSIIINSHILCFILHRYIDRRFCLNQFKFIHSNVDVYLFIYLCSFIQAVNIDKIHKSLSCMQLVN